MNYQNYISNDQMPNGDDQGVQTPGPDMLNYRSGKS